MYWLVLTSSSDIPVRNTGNNFIGEVFARRQNCLQGSAYSRVSPQGQKASRFALPFGVQWFRSHLPGTAVSPFLSGDQCYPHPCPLPVCTFLSSLPHCCCLASIKSVTPDSPQPVLLLPAAQPLYLKLQPRGSSVLCLPPQIRPVPFPPTALPGFLQHSMEQPPLATCSLMY